jgi:hypothetical protein
MVARDGVEPSTFRFHFKIHLIRRSRTTWHSACRGYVVAAPEAPRALELLHSPLDTARRYVGRGQAASASRACSASGAG